MDKQRPFDMPTAHLFKIWGGQIHEIEAVGLAAPQLTDGLGGNRLPRGQRF